MIKRILYRFENAVEVEEHHEGLFGAPGMARRKKARKSSEQVEVHNQRLKTTRCRRKLREHFQVNDYLATLTYGKDKRPESMEQAKADLAKFLRKIRAEYAKAGTRLKWIANIEVGSRGAWHVHIVLNRIPDADIAIRKAWQHGRVSFQLLHEHGEFRDLAAYITKTPATDKRLREACYKCSRGLDIPEPLVRKHFGRLEPLEKYRLPAGWYIDPDSVIEYENPVTGLPGRSFTLLRIRRATE